jgi:hypothetical protein
MSEGKQLDDFLIGKKRRRQRITILQKRLAQLPQQNWRAPVAIGKPIELDWSDEQTDDPLYADDRNFYKVEAWSRDGMRIDAPVRRQQPRQGARNLCHDRQAPAAHPADNPAADASAGRVAAEMKSPSRWGRG